MFLKEFLGITNVKSRFLANQLGFLNDIVKAYIMRFPFQNITSFGQYKPLDRTPPGFRQMVEANLHGGGGLCGHNNVFLMFQLKSLGYDVDLISGCFVRTGIPKSHHLIKVRIPYRLLKGLPTMNNLTGFKSYIVDVGCGIPLSETVCLDDLPYKGVAGGFQYRYERLDDNTVQRVNEGGDAIIGKKPANFKSPQDYTFNLNAIVNGKETKGPIAAVYTNPRSVFLHQGIYCFRYLDIQREDFEIVCIRGMDVIFITKETRTVQSFKSYQEIRPFIHKYFPMINSTEVDLTIENFSLPFEEAIRLSKNYKENSAKVVR